jgi:hypothetical protein
VVFGELGRRAGVDQRVEARRIAASAASIDTGGAGWPCQALAGRHGVEQFAFDAQLGLGLLQRRAVDQEGVLHALAQRRDLGQLQVDVVARQHAGDGVQQARAVAGGHGQQPALGAFVGVQRDTRHHREALHAARHAAAAGLGQRALAGQRLRGLGLDQRDQRRGSRRRRRRSRRVLTTWKVSSA